MQTRYASDSRVSYRFSGEKTSTLKPQPTHRLQPTPLWRVLLLVVLIAGAGCGDRAGAQRNGEGGTTAAQTATPERALSRGRVRAPAAQSVPTFTPTVALEAAGAAATPAPTPSAAQQLAAARQAYTNGNYARARSQLAPLLSNEDTTLRLHAHFELAKAYLVDGLYDEALTTLDLLDGDATSETVRAGSTEGATAAVPHAGSNLALSDILRLSQSPVDTVDADDAAQQAAVLRELALYLRGEALTGLGRYVEAIAAYQQVEAAHPWLTETVQEQIAAAYLALGDGQNAAAAYQSAAEAAAAANDTAGQARLLEALAETHISLGQYADAVAAYEDILAVAQNAGYRATIQYRAGQAAASGGDEAAAIAYWRVATAEAPANQHAYLALIELVNRQVDFDMYQRAYIDLLAGAWVPAINAYETYLASVDATDDRAGPAMLGLGQSYIGAGNYAAAITVLDNLLETYPECDCVGQAWLEKARAQAATGDSISARRTYRTFAREMPADPLAAEALWQSGLLALNEGKRLEGTVDLLALADTFPQNDRAPDALYVVALGAFRAGFNGQAETIFTRVQHDYPLYRRAAVHYWLGRVLQAQGETGAARRTWQALDETAAGAYHAVLSAHAAHPSANGNVLEDMHLIAGPPSRLEEDDGSQTFAEQWLVDWFEEAAIVFTAGDLAAPPADVAANTTLRAGGALLLLGQRDEGLRLLERVFTQNREQPAALYPLSLIFEQLGAYRLSLLAMEQLLALSPAELVEEAPVFLQRRVYPRRFADLVEQEARAHDLNPLLFYSLIRQESLFESGARSIAAAQGLAQIIPDTGAWVAEQLNYPNYTNAAVYRPHINLLFGAYYLDWARDYLDGDLIAALVGYNAGPGNAEHWRTLYPDDDALYVELLTYSEPRVYVQKIVSNLYHYTRLYAAP